jgi:hypothetical protein
VCTARLLTGTELTRIHAVRQTVTPVLIKYCPNKGSSLSIKKLFTPVSLGTLPEQRGMLLNRHLNKGTLGLGRQRRRATHLNGVPTNKVGTSFNFYRCYPKGVSKIQKA